MSIVRASDPSLVHEQLDHTNNSNEGGDSTDGCTNESSDGDNVVFVEHAKVVDEKLKKKVDEDENDNDFRYYEEDEKDSDTYSYDSDDKGSDEDSHDSDFIVDDEFLIDDIEVDMAEFLASIDIDANDEVDEEDENLEEYGLELDDFDSLSEDDDTMFDTVVKGIRRKRKKSKQSADCPFYVGQCFPDKEVVKTMVKEHAIKSKRQLFILRNEARRFRVVCHGIMPSLSGGCQDKANGNSSQKTQPKPTCPWTLHISKLKKEETWTVKTFTNEHVCVQSRDVNLCTVSWIAKEIEPILYVNPEIPLRSLQEIIQKKHQVQVTVHQIFRAKVKANEKVHGDYVAQYQNLREYSMALMKSDPGSTVKMEVEKESDPKCPTRQFKRIYICLGALKQGFKEAGRDILGLDGCFLKGPFPGQILTAVGVDANNGIYPVAYAVVEAENTETWTWFLEYLGDDLDLASNSNFTFMSDRQKGLIQAISKVYPSSEHRYCLRHIHENMKPEWSGELFKKLLWEAASATTALKHEKAMNDILKENKKLYDWLKKIPSKHWSRAFFKVRPKCDILLNNLCEVFNKQLVQGRDKPIITCLEFIRQYCMKKIVIVRKMIAKSNGPLTPNATKLFQKIKDDASQYSVVWCGNSKYQVSGPGGPEQEQRAVNIEDRSCGCRRWDLTGMPCRHAVACIWNMGHHGIGDGIPERWVHKAYWLDTWKNVYEHTIEPINGKDLWEKSKCPTTLIAPKYHKQIGRPKKKRKKSAVELEEVKRVTKEIETTGKMSRKGAGVTCFRCKQKGHNKRTCKAVLGRGGGDAQDGGVAS